MRGGVIGNDQVLGDVHEKRTSSLELMPNKRNSEQTYRSVLCGHKPRNLSVRRKKTSLLVSASGIVLAFQMVGVFTPANAQTTEAPQSLEEVVVTGTRINREGYEAPTPVAVIGIDQLQNQAGSSLGNLIATMPQFAGNVLPNNQQNGPSGGRSGISSANIRNLGINRSLVLMDGQRFVPVLTFGTLSTMAVDLGNIPQQLVARVDVVTAGASAVYGSDAVGGVTNFILDTEFTGIKADISGGVTDYGDGRNFKIDMSGGFGFAGGKGHVLLSGELSKKDAIDDSTNRAWNSTDWCIMNNPAYTATNGQPFTLTADRCGSVMALGGLINSGPLKGTAFGPGGTPYPFTYGAISGVLMQGGSYEVSNNAQTHGNALDPAENRQNVFARTSYDLGDTATVTYTYSWGHVESDTRSLLPYFNAATSLNISTSNPFIPEQLRPGLAGTTSFLIATVNGDVPVVRPLTDRIVMRNILSFDGTVDLFGSSWNWNAYYQHGQARNGLKVNSLSRSRFNLAIDAVSGPGGQIICRSTLTNPNNGCVPFNVMGEGVNSKAAKDYIYGVAQLNQTNVQQVWAASITGDAFELPAGPVSVALDVGHRKESAHGMADAGALANDYYSGNFKPINGAYSVSEGAVEVLVPLLKDQPLAESLELSLAARGADYTSSGFVATWKAGVTYSPVPDLMFRGNASRDIRAGNLGELYAVAGTLQVTTGAQDPFTQTTQTIRQSATGNPNLKPEKANGYGVGVVVQPSFISGLSASVDYWRVEIKDSIAALTFNQALQLCFSGNAAVCSNITRTGPATIPGAVGTPYAGQFFAPVDTVITSYVNIANSIDQGLDVSATYRFPLASIIPAADGMIGLNWNQSFYFRNFSNIGITGALPTYLAPSWRGVARASYDSEVWSASLSARVQPKPKKDPMIIECQSGCPLLSTIPANVTTRNYIYREASVFLDGNVSYKLDVGGAQSEIYLNIRNLLNRDPVLLPAGQPWNLPQAEGGDDTLGRIYRLGVRFQL